MSIYNPSSPCALGTLWRPFERFPFNVTSDLADGGTMEALVTSSVDEDIQAVWLWIELILGPSPGLPRYSVEVYDNDQLAAGSEHTTWYAPSSDVEVWVAVAFDSGFDNLCVGCTMWSHLDSPGDSAGFTLTPGTFGQDGGNTVRTAGSEWVTSVFGSGGTVSCGFNGITGTLDGKAIEKLTIRGYADVINTRPQSGAVGSWVPYVKMGTGVGDPVYTGPAITSRGGLISHDFFFNPQTGLPWTVADVEQFDTDNANYSAGFHFVGTNSNFVWPALVAMDLGVRYYDNEYRLALGQLTPDVGWNRVALTSLDGGTPSFSKVNGHQYVVALRRLDHTQPSLRMMLPLDNRNPQDCASQGYLALYNPNTHFLYHQQGVNGTAPQILLERTDDATSVDGQPYASLDVEYHPALGVIAPWSYVDTSQSPEQDFTAPSTLNYGSITLMCRPAYPGSKSVLTGTHTNPTAPLEINLYRRSDDALIAGPITLNLSDLDQPIDNWHLLNLEFPSPGALVSGTQYYVKFTNSDAHGSGWRVQVGSFRDPSASGGGPSDIANCSIGGATDTGHVGAATFLDFLISLHTEPPAPGDFTVTPTDDNGTTPVLPKNVLAWTATDVEADGCTFLWYEIQRSVDGGTTWVPWAHVTNEAVVTVNDEEPPLNQETQYRIRASRTDGCSSVWVTGSGTPTTARCGFYFSSNEAPGSGLWYDDMIAKSFQITDTVTLLTFDDRDGAVAFRGLEDRYDTFQTQLFIAADKAFDGTQVASPAGRKAFDPLLNLIGSTKNRTTGEKTTTSYTCVRTKDGDIWYAAVFATGDAVVDEPGGRYSIKVTVRETTRTPSIIEVSS